MSAFGCLNFNYRLFLFACSPVFQGPTLHADFLLPPVYGRKAAGDSRHYDHVSGIYESHVLYPGTTSEFPQYVFFRRTQILIPLVIILLCLSIYPFLSVAIFLGVFLLEVLAKLYFQLPQDHRLPVKILASYAGAASVVSVAALLAVPFMPSRVYYLIGGTVILALCAFFRWAGNDRTRCACPVG